MLRRQQNASSAWTIKAIGIALHAIACWGGGTIAARGEVFKDMHYTTTSQSNMETLAQYEDNNTTNKSGDCGVKLTKIVKNIDDTLRQHPNGPITYANNATIFKSFKCQMVEFNSIIRGTTSVLIVDDMGQYISVMFHSGATSMAGLSYDKETMDVSYGFAMIDKDGLLQKYKKY